MSIFVISLVLDLMRLLHTIELEQFPVWDGANTMDG